MYNIIDDTLMYSRVEHRSFKASNVDRRQLELRIRETYQLKTRERFRCFTLQFALALAALAALAARVQVVLSGEHATEWQALGVAELQ